MRERVYYSHASIWTKWAVVLVQCENIVISSFRKSEFSCAVDKDKQTKVFFNYFSSHKGRRDE